MAGIDKLSILNNALLATGNNTCTDEDGSDEWMVASSAYERMLPVVMARKEWHFETIVKDLVRQGSSTFPGLTDIYAKPADCLRIETCWDTLVGQTMNGLPYVGLGRYDLQAPEFAYRIIGDGIHCIGPNGVTCLYTPMPKQGDPASVGFIEALTLEIESIILRGLNETDAEALKVKQGALMEAKEAAYEEDSQEPRRAGFRSGLAEARRRRRYGQWIL